MGQAGHRPATVSGERRFRLRTAGASRRAARGFAALAAAVSIALAGIGPPTSVEAQERSSDEIARELAEAKRQASQLASELGSVRSDIGRIEEELAEIGARLEDARARLISAEGQVALAVVALEDALAEQAAAQAALATATRLLERTEIKLQTEEALLIDQLVQTFKYGTVGAQRGAMALEVLRRADDPNAFAVGMKQLQTVVDVQDRTVTRVFELRDEHAARTDDAARAQARATQATVDARETLEVLEGLREEAARIAQEVADEEEARQRVLATLRENAQNTSASLQRVSTRQNQLTRDLAAERAREEAARRAAAEAAARREAEQAAAASGGGGGTSSSGGGVRSSAGGDRLATPGASGSPVATGLVCPVVGAVAGRDYSNDWGYPRSGGRYHQGNDMFASRGTPVVAVDDALVVRWNPPSSPTGLGGITVTYRTSEGSEWYNAHLDTVAEGIAPGVSVSRGQQIGTVGQTGNARSTPPHLHIGRRVGGVWVNPWPSTSPVC